MNDIATGLSNFYVMGGFLAIAFTLLGMWVTRDANRKDRR
jgi:hypothetical protein